MTCVHVLPPERSQRITITELVGEQAIMTERQVALLGSIGLWAASYDQRACEANPAGENSSFIFTVCVESVPLYHFKLAYVFPHMPVKERFETHF